MKRRLASLVLAAAFTTGAPASAAPKRGREFQARFEAGIAAYQKKDYRAAATELAAAYELVPDPDVAFALAQALRQAGMCDEALPFYREILTGDVSPQRRRAIEEAMAPCEAQAAAAEVEVRPRPRPRPRTEPAREPVGELTPPDDPVVAPPPPASDATPSSADLSRSASEPAPRWYRDVLGTSLVIVGVAGLGLGGTGLMLADGHYATAEKAESERAFSAAIASGDRWRNIGVGALIGGGALTAVGVVRWIVVAGRDGERDAVSLVPDPRGGVIIAGEF